MQLTQFYCCIREQESERERESESERERERELYGGLGYRIACASYSNSLSDWASLVFDPSVHQKQTASAPQLGVIHSPSPQLIQPFHRNLWPWTIKELYEATAKEQLAGKFDRRIEGLNFDNACYTVCCMSWNTASYFNRLATTQNTLATT